jgi:hypothetical protein
MCVVLCKSTLPVIGSIQALQVLMYYTVLICIRLRQITEPERENAIDYRKHIEVTYCYVKLAKK